MKHPENWAGLATFLYVVAVIIWAHWMERKKPAPVIKIFTESGDFAALNSAHAWLKKRGFSYGSLQREAPVGIVFGEIAIAEWRNLSTADRKMLDGLLTGEDKRNGPVTVEIFSTASTEALDAAAERAKAE